MIFNSIMEFSFAFYLVLALILLLSFLWLGSNGRYENQFGFGELLQH